MFKSTFFRFLVCRWTVIPIQTLVRARDENVINIVAHVLRLRLLLKVGKAFGRRLRKKGMS